MQKKILLLASVFFLFLSFSQAHAVENVKYRLLLQVSEDSVDRLNQALNISKQVNEQYGPENIEIQIIVFGAGVQTLKYYAPIPIADKVKEVRYEGVRIAICDYSMKNAKLKPSDMLQDVTYVPSGVGEILEKVSKGWVLVRP